MKVLIEHAAEVVCVGAGGAGRRTGAAMGRPVVVPDGAVVIEGERIAWVGPTDELPPTYLRYLERQLREAFDFGPTPLKLRVRRRAG